MVAGVDVVEYGVVRYRCFGAVGREAQHYELSFFGKLGQRVAHAAVVVVFNVDKSGLGYLDYLLRCAFGHLAESLAAFKVAAAEGGSTRVEGSVLAEYLRGSAVYAVAESIGRVEYLLAADGFAHYVECDRAGGVGGYYVDESAAKVGVGGCGLCAAGDRKSVV